MSGEFRVSQNDEPQILVGGSYLTHKELTDNVRFSACFALGGAAMSAVSAYATFKMFENNVADEILPLAAPGGGLTLGLGMLKVGAGNVISSIRNRRALRDFHDQMAE